MTTGNLTTEQDYSLTCNVCDETQTVRVCTVRKDKYLHGALVQDAFPEPEFDSAYREQIIGLRVGKHVCNNCWDSLFSEDDDE